MSSRVLAPTDETGLRSGWSRSQPRVPQAAHPGRPAGCGPAPSSPSQGRMLVRPRVSLTVTEVCVFSSAHGPRGYPASEVSVLFYH